MERVLGSSQRHPHIDQDWYDYSDESPTRPDGCCSHKEHEFRARRRSLAERGSEGMVAALAACSGASSATPAPRLRLEERGHGAKSVDPRPVVEVARDEGLGNSCDSGGVGSDIDCPAGTSCTCAAASLGVPWFKAIAPIRA